MSRRGGNVGTGVGDAGVGGAGVEMGVASGTGSAAGSIGVLIVSSAALSCERFSRRWAEVRGACDAGEGDELVQESWPDCEERGEK